MTTFEFTGCPDCGSMNIVARKNGSNMSGEDAIAFILSDTNHFAFSIICKDCEYTESHSVTKR